MKKLIAGFTLICIWLGVLGGALANTTGVLPASDTPTIYLAGDSTAASYDSSRSPLTGWGQALWSLLPKNVTVENHAKSGRSSKSFVDEGLLDKILADIKKGDYLVIQFGHNDQKAGDEARFTEADGSFKEYLKQYIDGARSREAIPVLATPIERRRFSGGKVVQSLGPQTKAMIELAKAENVTLIDINAATIRYFNALGEEGTKNIFLILGQDESPNYPEGITDNTHLNEEGAVQISKIFLADLAKTDLPIAKFIKGIDSPAPPAPVEEVEENEIKTPVHIETNLNEDVLKGYLKAAEELMQLGILQGYEDGGLGEEKELTRAEFTTIVARILNLKDNTYDLQFNDVSPAHWAAGNIAAATAKGILNGYGNGKFGPEDSVTYDQAVKILVEALGGGASAAEQGPYPWGYLLEGAEIGISAGTVGTAGMIITRGAASKMIYNALYVKNADGAYLADNTGGKLYYVSPSGSDEGDGSFSRPWQSIEMVVSQLTAGQTAIFDEGIYTVSENINLSTNGTENEGIVLRSRGNAILVFDEDSSLNISGDYISFKGFEIRGKTEDQNISVKITGKNGSFADNMVKTFDNDAIYISNADEFEISSNKISGGGITIYNTPKAVINGNEITDAVLGGIRAYASKNLRIYNNIIMSDQEEVSSGILLGEKDGVSVENSVLLNNVLASKTIGFMETGIAYESALSCHSYNNAIINTIAGVTFSGKAVNPVLKNNIYSGCLSDAYVYEKMPQGFESDYNVFHNTYPHMSEPNSLFKDPMFTDIYSDWRLVGNSPAIGKGINPGSVFVNEEKMDLDLISMDEIHRHSVWSIGPMEGVSDSQVESSAASRYHPSALLFQDSFEARNTKWKASTGEWETDGGRMKQISPAVARSVIRYEGGEEWEDYDFSADIMSPDESPENTNGIIFRSDEKMHNMYTFRIYGNTHLEFAKWQNGQFSSILKWEHDTTPDTMYNLRVLAKGNKITFYLNDQKVKETTDFSYDKGTVGLYTFRQKGEFDNLKVYKVD